MVYESSLKERQGRYEDCYSRLVISVQWYERASSSSTDTQILHVVQPSGIELRAFAGAITITLYPNNTPAFHPQELRASICG